MTDKVLDPVCKMEVDPQKAYAKLKYEGQTYYFCTETCLNKFEADPEKYISELPEGPDRAWGVHNVEDE